MTPKEDTRATGKPKKPAKATASKGKSHADAKTSDRFPIVGIGASAGGLAAFEAFFSGMPKDKDTGMAFVLIQHLAPDHNSMLTELVRHYTRMQVFEVEDGMVVKPNCVYVIPPNRNMGFINGSLHLFERDHSQGGRMPIDFFFRSMADDQHERAICVVLSGTASDGTLGVRAIKGEGGMTMVQHPDSAEFDGMPRSAIATGLADYIMPPAEMPACLIDYAKHLSERIAKPRPEEDDKTRETLNKVLFVLRDRTGHDFSLYKHNTICRRIERRMAVQQIKLLQEYLRYLEINMKEVDALFHDLLIGVTCFFRDSEVFDALQKDIIPELFSGKTPGSSIRIWIPGCSTGEEAYSMAILIQEHIDTLKQNFQVQIFATDIDNRAIDVARIGQYPASIASDISPERLSRFFVEDPEASSYSIKRSIRDMMVFSEQDVIQDPPFSRLDIISCRNLLIYMGADLQKRLMPLFHYSLKPKGVLVLGTSETVGDFTGLFGVKNRKCKLYEKKEGLSDGHPHVFGKCSAGRTEVMRGPSASARPDAGNKIGLREIIERTMLLKCGLVGALVTEKGDILYLHGRTGMYLEPSPGTASQNILQMAREGLRRELTTALHKAVVQKEPISHAGLSVKTNGHFTTVNLTIWPAKFVPDNADGRPLFVVMIEEAPAVSEKPDRKVRSSQRTGKKAEEAEARIEALLIELRSKDEYIQSTHEEMETSNEELKSSNEEMQSVNEELQSTNEELETSKEELQSVNEELATVNTELQNKVADLSVINNDMNNLLAGTGVGTLFVDHQLRIRRFTPSITKAVNLIPTDVGRPVEHILSNFVDYDDLVSDTQVVLDSLTPKQIEVQVKDGTWHSLKIQPYRTIDNVIEGAVITLVDISETKKAQ